LSLDEAATAAILEMAQMEIGTGLAKLKLRERGPEGLSASDRRHLERSLADPASALQLRPAAASLPPTLDAADAHSLIGHLETMSVPVYAVDLSRSDIGVPVMRALSPNLQPFSLDATCQRFVARCSGARPQTTFSPY
ncbi:MAG: YcaO-like family protein, partial [Beijerinckiaceae bacterium]